MPPSNKNAATTIATIGQLEWDAAQNLLDHQQHTAAINNKLRSDIRDYVRPDTLMGALIISRSVRSAAWNALSTEVYDELVHRVLPAFRNGEPLLPAASDLDYRSDTIDQPYEGATDNFMRDLSAWILGTSEAVFQRLAEDNAAPGYQLWKGFLSSSDDYRTAWLQLAERRQRLDPPRLPEPGSPPDEDPRVVWHSGATGNAQDALMCLVARQKARETRIGSTEDADVMAKILLADIDILRWGAFLGRRHFREVFPRPPGITNDRLVWHSSRQADDPFAGYETVLEEIGPVDSPTCRWQYPGMQAIPSFLVFCPSRRGLVPKMLQAREENELFLAVKEQRAGRWLPREGNGRLDTATTLLTVAAEIGRHTILAA